MIVLLVLIFGLLAALAAGLVVRPLLRRSHTDGDARTPGLLAALAVGAILLFGFGTYGVLGQPQLALQALKGPSNTDLPSLIATLAYQMPRRPDDARGWTVLGRGYLRLGDSDQAVKALSRAVDLTREQQGKAPAELLISYGAALALDDQAEPAEKTFREVLTAEPANPDARYLLGLLYAQAGDRAGALKLWGDLLPDVPADAPWRQAFLEQLAAVKAAPAGAAPNAPDIPAMVARLAARLDANPKDIDGWVMLVRAYGVLGEKDKAVAALAKARAVFAGDAGAIGALDAQAKASGLN